MKKCLTGKIKTLNIMKICTLQIALALVLSGLAIAHDNYGQLLDKKVTLTLKDASLEEAIKAIEDIAKVKFFYSLDQLDVKEKITLQVMDKTLRETLDLLLTPYDVKFKVREKQSTITLKKIRTADRSQFDVPGENEPAQNKSARGVRTITGRVTDAATQQPMPGVNIIIKGTTVGTATDAEGNFSINADEGDVLTFSFIGYATVDISVDGKTVIDVSMEEDIKSLKEVEINAGYYKTTKALQTGNITRVESSEIEKQPVSNPLAALQGRVPGLEIMQQSGVPGGNFQVRIRGQNSIANGNDPLFIIDGVPYLNKTMAFRETSQSMFLDGTSPLNGINPSDIESIEVLKDADATAIYGSRGSNGVILITTKRGKPGKARVNLNFYSGAGRVASKMDLLNTEEYIRMRMLAFQNDGLTPTSAPDLLAWDTTRYTDWQKELIGGTAATTDAQFSLSGGEGNHQFVFGGGYHRESAVFPGSSADARISMHTALNSVSANQKLRSSVSMNYSINDTDLIKQDLTGIALTIPPNAPPLYNSSHDLNWGTELNTDTWVAPYLNHPLAYLETGYEARTKNLLLNSVVAYEIVPDLELKVNLGHSNVNMSAITTTPKSFYPPTATDPQNETAFSNSNFTNWIVEPQLNWTIKADEGTIDILAGGTLLQQEEEGLSQFASGFSAEALMKNLSAASIRTMATNYHSQYRYNAVFGRVNYNLKNKYIINVTGRRDGSSRFGPGKQFANFGAIGAAWVFSRENFLSANPSFLSFGKLRASYGITGNDQLANYQYLDTYTSSDTYMGVVGLKPVRLANADFAWETNKKLEGTLELSFLNDRIITTTSYYRNRSSDQLVGLPLPPTTGFSSIQSNFPAVVENSGLEIEITTINIDKPGLSWATSINYSRPRNKLVEFPNLDASPTYAQTLVVGEPLSIFKVYQYTGVDVSSGLYAFEDVNADGTLNALDRQAVRFVGRDFYGGILNTVEYKGFALSVMMQFIKQTKLHHFNAFSLQPGGGLSNQPGSVFDLSNSNEDELKIQKYTTSPQGLSAYSYFRASTEAITDASFLRLKNISISYVFRPEWLAKLHIEHAKFFVQGQNLLTITDYDGLDPEPSGNTSLPPLKIWSCGLHLTL